MGVIYIMNGNYRNAIISTYGQDKLLETVTIAVTQNAADALHNKRLLSSHLKISNAAFGVCCLVSFPRRFPISLSQNFSRIGNISLNGESDADDSQRFNPWVVLPTWHCNLCSNY